jgi:hypothetical protein
MGQDGEDGQGAGMTGRPQHRADSGDRAAGTSRGAGGSRAAGGPRAGAELADAVQREIEADRKWEYRLWPKTLIALAVVAVLVVIRQVFFP